MYKILIIEDDDKNMKLAKDVLSMHGYATLEANNAEEGLALIQNELPDVILLDVEMAGMDGLALTRILKQDKRTSQIDLVILTARAMKGDEDILRAAGANHYLSKPYQYKDLLSIVKQCCENKTTDLGIQ